MDANSIRSNHHKDNVRTAIQTHAPDKLTAGEIAATTDVEITASVVRRLSKELADEGEINVEQPAQTYYFWVEKPDAEATPDEDDDEIPACPACDSSRLRKRTLSIQSSAKGERPWLCKDCGELFKTPTYRERQPGGGESAESILERVRADIEAERETATDGSGGQR